MSNIKLKIIKNFKYIDGQVFYKDNEFIFETNDGKGEFSIIIGKGYCELSVARFNSRIYSFGGINIKDEWISKKLTFPNNEKGELYIDTDTTDIINYDGVWYTENWDTYYDKENNFICIGDYNVDSDDIAVEFCRNIIAVLKNDELKSIWIKNIIWQ